MITTQIALAVQRRYDIAASRMYNAARIVNANQIQRLASGNYAVISQSDPRKTYSINPKHESCTCPNATDVVKIVNGVKTVVKHGELCKHLTAWLLMREQIREQNRKIQSAIKNLGVEGARAALTTLHREAAARAKRDETKRTEWVEELDLT